MEIFALIRRTIMSELDKDNKDFEFIKEQVIQKKRKKFRKWLIPFLMTIIMAVIFGLVAALTFCLAEPKLYKLLHKDEPNPFEIPSPVPNPIENEQEDEEPSDDHDKSQGSIDDLDEEDDDDLIFPSQSQDDNPNGQVDENPPTVTQQVIVETIDADINDYLTMFNEIKALSKETGKSILTVSSIIDSKDWFGNPIEKRIYTTGVVVNNSAMKLMLLVSLDRVKDATSIHIELNDTTSIKAELLDYESELNLAIISASIVDIPAKFLSEISVASLGESYTISPGSPIIALGSPNGYPSSIDIGIITSKGSYISITDSELGLFNTNMVFNNESDGVIVNLKGEVIGLITRTLKKDLNKELSTIVGISKVKSYIDRMVDGKPRIYCGLIAEDIPEDVKQEYNVTGGIYVYEVKTDSPAFKGGLMSGDIILKVGDRTIYNMNTFYSSISNYEPGTEVIFKIKRTSGSLDKEMELKVILEAKKQ